MDVCEGVCVCVNVSVSFTALQTYVCYRFACTVCQRDFKSLSALNGHMRSHGGFRAATRFNKVHTHTHTHIHKTNLRVYGTFCGPLVPHSITVQSDLMSVPAFISSSLPFVLQTQNTSPLITPTVSMVMPVTVPVQSKGTAKVCSKQQRSCSRLSAARGGAVLYRSLLHRDAEAAVKSRGGDDEEVLAEEGEAAVIDAHYTPPTMLCPLRAGPGLHCSLTTRKHQRVQTVQLHSTQGT